MTVRVLISADMEGVIGTTQSRQIKSTHENPRFNMLASQEINHIAKQLKSIGAVVDVVDAHGIGTNLLIEELDAVSSLTQGGETEYGMMQGIAECDAIVLAGYHGSAQNISVMHHTHSSTLWPEVTIDGKIAGEVTINMLLARAFGKPLIFVTGTDEAIKEAETVEPGISTVTTKKSLGKLSCVHRNRNEVLQEYAEKISKIAIKQIDAENTPKRFLVKCITKESVSIPETKKIDDYTYEIQGDTYIQQYKNYLRFIDSIALVNS